MIDFETIIARQTKGNKYIHGVLGWLRGTQPAVPVAVTGPVLLRRPYTIRGDDLDHHFWIKGATRYGKSKFLEKLFLGLHNNGETFALIDPHGDLAVDLLWSIADTGYFNKPHAKEKLLYIDFSNEERSLPWNIIDTAESTFDKAANVDTAFKRMFPDLLKEAPIYQNVIRHAVIVLIENNLPLTKIQSVLVNGAYRNELLKNVTYPDVREFFRLRYDTWKNTEMRESTLNKISILTLSPTFRHAFGQMKNSLNFRKFMDEGISVIFNLSGLHEDVQKFIGALLMVGFEQAALSRAKLPRGKRRPLNLGVDECHNFMDKSHESLSKILPQTLKFGLRLFLLHQYLEQLNGLESALGAAAKVFFRTTNNLDATYSARELHMYDPFEVHRAAPTEKATDKDYTPIEAFTKGAQQLMSLTQRNAIIRIENWNEEIKTLKIPPRTLPYEDIEKLIASYARELLTPIADLLPTPTKPEPVPAYDLPPLPVNTRPRKRRSRSSSGSSTLIFG